MADRRGAEKSGRRAETLAGLLLRLKGYRILSRRFKTPVGEIDIVARRGRLLAFVEVKHRRSSTLAGDALEAVDTARISRAAGWYLARHPHCSGLDCRFDVIFLAPGRWPHHLCNAFMAS